MNSRFLPRVLFVTVPIVIALCLVSGTGATSGYVSRAGSSAAPAREGGALLPAASGDLDPTFGQGGKAITNFGGITNSIDYAGALVVQADGKLVAAGYFNTHSEGGLGLARYNTNGSLDPSFGTDGVVATGLGARYSAEWSDLAIQPDGKLVAVGTASDGVYSHGALARYNPDGSLDSNFGGGGIVTTTLGSTFYLANAVAIQQDGKIVIAGYGFDLARFNPDGTLDTTFGTGGFAFISEFQRANAVLVQPDGKLVVAGYGGGGDGSFYFYMALARLNPDGTLDSTFGTGGKVTADVGYDDDVAYDVVLQPDGKLVIAGYAAWGSWGSLRDFAILRFNSDGSPDTGFGDNGVVTTDLGSNLDIAYALSVQNDGKLAVGGVFYGTGSSDFALVRYNANGSLDSSFGSGGIVTTSFGGYAKASAVQIQSDGKLVAAGQCPGDFALARYHTDGSLDTGFDTDGKLTTNLLTGMYENSSDQANALVVQPDGKLVAAGYAGGTAGDFALVRHNPDGSLDATFGTGGRVTTTIGTRQDGAAALVLQPDGKLVAAGWTETASSVMDYALVRYNEDGTLDPSFGVNGIVVTTDLSATVDQVYALGRQSDGKLIAAGDHALVRYNPDGSLDSSFGVGGVVPAYGMGHYNSPIYVRALATQTDGKILVAGGTPYLPIPYSFALVRYNPDGSVDTGFGSAGLVTTTIGGRSSAFALAFQPDHKIVVAGGAGWAYDLVGLARYNPDGTLDSAFGNGGIVTTTIGSGDTHNYAYAILLQPDRKIVVAGVTYYGHEDIVLVRYNPDGALDTTFGVNGVVIHHTNLPEIAYALAMQNDGKLVIAGLSQADFLVARYQNDVAFPEPVFAFLPVVLRQSSSAR